MIGAPTIRKMAAVELLATKGIENAFTNSYRSAVLSNKGGLGRSAERIRRIHASSAHSRTAQRLAEAKKANVIPRNAPRAEAGPRALALR